MPLLCVSLSQHTQTCPLNQHTPIQTHTHTEARLNTLLTQTLLDYNMYKTEQHKLSPSPHISLCVGVKLLPFSSVLILFMYIFSASNYTSLSCLSSEGVKRDGTLCSVIGEKDLHKIPKDVLPDVTEAFTILAPSNLQNPISSIFLNHVLKWKLKQNKYILSLLSKEAAKVIMTNHSCNTTDVTYSCLPLVINCFLNTHLAKV